MLLASLLKEESKSLPEEMSWIQFRLWEFLQEDTRFSFSKETISNEVNFKGVSTF